MKRVDFWSSTEYTTFLPGLARALEAQGWHAESKFAMGEEKYRSGRSSVVRLWIRALAYGWYPLQLAAAMRWSRRTDVAVVTTNTFYAPRIAERVARSRGVPVVHWVYDLFPDVLVAAGVISAGSRRERVLKRWVRATFDRAAANVFLSQQILARAEAYFGPIARTCVIPVGCDAAPFADARPVHRSSQDPVRILYCGNFGRMHDVETLIGALRPGLPHGLQLEIRGHGAGFQRIERELGAGTDSAIKLGPSLTVPEWKEAMMKADVALVTMKTGAEGIVMPSKTYSALAAGQAVLAVCPPTSDLAETLRTHACGWQVNPGDESGLRRTFSEILADPEGRLRCRRNAWEAGRKVFDQTILAARWRDVLDAARI